jgi:hypothetical protein
MSFQPGLEQASKHASKSMDDYIVKACNAKGVNEMSELQRNVDHTKMRGFYDPDEWLFAMDAPSEEELKKDSRVYQAIEACTNCAHELTPKFQLWSLISDIVSLNFKKSESGPALASHAEELVAHLAEVRHLVSNQSTVLANVVGAVEGLRATCNVKEEGKSIFEAEVATFKQACAKAVDAFMLGNDADVVTQELKVVTSPHKIMQAAEFSETPVFVRGSLTEWFSDCHGDRVSITLRYIL